MQAGVWIERSEPVSMDIELQIAESDHILPVLSPLLPHIQRWRSFTIEGQQERVFLKDINPAASRLTDLRIDISIQEDLDRKPHSIFTTDDQRFGIHVDVIRLPSSRLLEPLRIIDLKLSEDSPSYLQSDPREILDFLSACPELQTFCFVGWHHNEFPSTDPLPVVSLTQLHTMQLKSTCMTRAILSHLDTPRLANVSLAQLNGEFELNGEYNEEGDSEDEAHDFSQSPSTDRAIGMGLRTLINRCDPPIQFLDMDYSDLRTKDFRFIFERLPLLQDFRIVASDMSNTVIGLLRPYSLPGDQFPRIRLCRLRSLFLRSCNRLSGDAVFDALAARVHYTNQQLAFVEPLSNVSIITCNMVGFEHSEKLRELLGNKLHLQLA
ncbi:hypothetical protein C0992_008456 [Termitomyces sp. T32_za158]|nr:hypothetical protein C0992_008456 [Termitomyces sp. T32_za158]